MTAQHITVLGCGRWGSFLAWYLAGLGHIITLYGRPDSGHMQAFQKDRKNELLTLPDNVSLATDLSCLRNADLIVVSVPSQALRGLLSSLPAELVTNKTVVLCMKGIEVDSGMRLSQVAKATLPPSVKVAVWLGPGHVQDFCAGIPNCMVIDSDNPAAKQQVVDICSGGLIRLYYGDDLIGNEIGAAAKNVIGIAAGILDGFGLPSLKGALMARGAREIARLIRAVGGKELSAYGLCHLGDYEATVFSKHSHNRAFGEAFVQKKEFGALAEGYYTVVALKQLAEQHGVELPICFAVYAILYQGMDPKAALEGLFSRSQKSEF